MKIAISTNNGIRMAPAFETSRGFMVLTLKLGEIVEEEMRPFRNPGNEVSGDLISQVSDCSTVIVRNITENSMQFLCENKIAVHRTKEEIITNVIVHYLEHQYREASNTCTCP
jgi:predicted Fe-Mo cluster-binding NifX family protein